MKKILSLLILAISALSLAPTSTSAQSFTPPASAIYLYNTGTSTWGPATGTGTTGALPYTPPSYAAYCYNTGTSQWVAATTAGNCFGGGGGSGTVTSFSFTNGGGFLGTVTNSTTTPTLALTVDSTHFLPTNTGPATTYLNGAGAYSTPAGAAPGGTPNQQQYQINSTTFGGFTQSGDCTTTVATGVTLCTKTGGVAFAPAATSTATNLTAVAYDSSGNPVQATAIPGADISGSVASTKGIVNNSLVDGAPTTVREVDITDSIGLPIHGDYPGVFAATVGYTNITRNSIGGASLVDLASCNATGCTATSGPGSTFPYQIGTFPLVFPLGITNNTHVNINMGFNDQSNIGTSPTAAQRDYFRHGVFAWLLILGIPDTQKYTAASACTVATGTWTAAGGTYPAGTMQSTGVGSMTCVLTGGSTTDAGIIGIKNVNDTTAVYTITVANAGTTYGVVDPYTNTPAFTQTGSYTSAYSGVWNYYAAGQSSMAGGATTVTYSCTAASSSFPCIFVGPYFISKSTSLQNAPKVDYMLISRAPTAGHTDATTNIMRQEELLALQEAHDNGLNVTWWDPNAKPLGYDATLLADNGAANQYVVTSGGSGYTTGNVTTTSGCSIPATGVAPVVGGVLTPGTYYFTNFGACTGTPTVSATGGGTGAVITSTLVQDGIHPNSISAPKMAATMQAQQNSAVAVQDRTPTGNGILYSQGKFNFNCPTFVGGTPSLLFCLSLTTSPAHAQNSNLSFIPAAGTYSSGIGVILQTLNDLGTAEQVLGLEGSKVILQGLSSTSPVCVFSVTCTSGFNVGTANQFNVSSTTGLVTAPGYFTLTNCSSSASPAVCGAAAAGSVVVAATATTVAVNTSAVTANSQIQLTFDSSLGTKLGVTCNTTGSLLMVSARTAGTSFTITTTAPAVNPACISYTITN